MHEGIDSDLPQAGEEFEGFLNDFSIGDDAAILRSAEYQPPRYPIAAVYPSRRHLSAKVRTCVDFLAERFAREQPWSLAAGASTP